MPKEFFPDLVRKLPDFEGPFDAHRLTARGCDVLFAAYPAGTVIEPHTHPTRNVGVITSGELILTRQGEEQRYGVGDWYELEPDEEHAARFPVDTAGVEFWFEA